MKTNTTIQYRLSLLNENCWFSELGYSKYYHRVDMYKKGIIDVNDIYGYDQCLEHMEELKNGKLGERYEKAKFKISIITTVTTEIEIK